MYYLGERGSPDQLMASTTDAPTLTEPLENDHEIDEIDGGALVYEVETEYRPHLGRDVIVCRTLVGFAKVTDWDLVRSELRTRGHDIGAIYHLPSFVQ